MTLQKINVEVSRVSFEININIGTNPGSKAEDGKPV